MFFSFSSKIVWGFVFQRRDFETSSLGTQKRRRKVNVLRVSILLPSKKFGKIDFETFETAKLNHFYFLVKNKKANAFEKEKPSTSKRSGVQHNSKWGRKKMQKRMKAKSGGKGWQSSRCKMTGTLTFSGNGPLLKSKKERTAPRRKKYKWNAHRRFTNSIDRILFFSSIFVLFPGIQ